MLRNIIHTYSKEHTHMSAFIGAAMGCDYGWFVMWLVGFVVCGVGLYILALVLFPIGGILRARERIATDSAVDDFIGIKRSGLSRDRRAIEATVTEVDVVKGNYQRYLSKKGFLELFIFVIEDQRICVG
jgi:hypothetical protein